jgi:hypothetical protein
MCSCGDPGRTNYAHATAAKAASSYGVCAYMQNTTHKHPQWILLSRLINYIPMHMLCAYDGDTDSAPCTYENLLIFNTPHLAKEPGQPYCACNISSERYVTSLCPPIRGSANIKLARVSCPADCWRCKLMDAAFFPRQERSIQSACCKSSAEPSVSIYKRPLFRPS